MSSKPRVVKDYDKLDEPIQEQIKLAYPYGFKKHLIKFKNQAGELVSALPFETDDRYYLVRMTVEKAQAIIRNDDDYDDAGVLRPKVKNKYLDRYSDDESDDDDPTDEDLDGVDLGFDDDDDEEDADETDEADDEYESDGSADDDDDAIDFNKLKASRDSDLFDDEDDD